MSGTGSLRKRGLLRDLWVRKGQPGREDGETPFPQSRGLRVAEGSLGEGKRGRQGHSSPAHWGTIGELSLGGGGVSWSHLLYKKTSWPACGEGLCHQTLHEGTSPLLPPSASASSGVLSMATASESLPGTVCVCLRLFCGSTVTL